MPLHLKIGILETGRPKPALLEKHGGYPDLFRRLLGEDEFSFTVYSVIDGHVPKDPGEQNGWLVTGSPHGVYEELPWMLETENFLRRVVDARIPLIGICFGHQILAKALGGTVVQSDKGWGLGISKYQITHPAPFMQPPLPEIAIASIHQDQVVALPATARVIASSDHCPFAMLAYGETAFSIQSHPEFSSDYLRETIDHADIEPARKNAAKDTIDRVPTDAATIAAWMKNFLKKDSHVTQ